MTNDIEQKAFIEIRDHVHQVALKASYANFYVEKMNEMLKNDHRIVYNYMKQQPTFLNTVEYGVVNPNQSVASEIRKDLSLYSGGNSELVNEYMSNTEFIENVTKAHEYKREIVNDVVHLEETLVNNRFPSEQRGVAVILHKAEHDQYKVFETSSEDFNKELRKDLSELVRHEPFQKSQEEIERDRQALEAQKRKQMEIRKQNELARKQQEYDEKNGRNTTDVDLNELDNRTSLEKQNAGIYAPESPVEDLEFAIGDYHESLREGDSKYRESQVDEISFNLGALGYNVDSIQYKETKFKLLSGNYSKDEQEFRSQFIADAKQSRMTQEQRESQEYSSRWENEKVSYGNLEDVLVGKERYEWNKNQEVNKMDVLLKDNPILSENEGFKNVYKAVQENEFKGRHEIERILEAVNLPQVDSNVIDSLNEINYQSHVLQQHFNYAHDYERTQTLKDTRTWEVDQLSKENGSLTEEVQSLKKEISDMKDLHEKRVNELLKKVESLEKDNDRLTQEKEEMKPRRSLFSLER